MVIVDYKVEIEVYHKREVYYDGTIDAPVVVQSKKKKK